MAWESRQGRRYYYRKTRAGKRVHSSYVGSGETAELIAKIEEMEREQAEQERQAQRRQAAKEQATDEQIAALIKLADEHIRALMIVTGYHQHKRQWRKQR